MRRPPPESANFLSFEFTGSTWAGRPGVRGPAIGAAGRGCWASCRRRCGFRRRPGGRRLWRRLAAVRDHGWRGRCRPKERRHPCVRAVPVLQRTEASPLASRRQGTPGRADTLLQLPATPPRRLRSPTIMVGGSCSQPSSPMKSLRALPRLAVLARPWEPFDQSLTVVVVPASPGQTRIAASDAAAGPARARAQVEGHSIGSSC